MSSSLLKDDSVLSAGKYEVIELELKEVPSLLCWADSELFLFISYVDHFDLALC